MGAKPQPWPVLETSRNRALRLSSMVGELSDEPWSRPMPAHIPGQLSLWRTAADEEREEGLEFVIWS
jgi:hypothetical protein